MNINILGVPVYYGCDKKGVDNGPDTLRESGLQQILDKYNNTKDLGNVKVLKVDDSHKFSSHPTLKYLDEIVHCNNELATMVYSSLQEGSFPFIVGGDHSIGLGSIAGASKFYGQDLGVIWIDAHGDINTPETSPSGNIHGMPLASSFGLGHEKLTSIFFKGSKIKMDNVFILAARDLDQGELDLIKENNLNVWTFNDIKEKGLETCLNELLFKVSEKNLENLHLSFDIDCLDPEFVPGTGTPVEDGLNVQGGCKVLETLIASKLIRSIDFVEFNPSLDSTSTTLNNCLTLLEEISLSLSKTEN
ncbi:MAG: arginase [Clostridium sp.]